MANIHVVSAITPNPKTNITEALAVMLRRNGHTVTSMQHDQVADTPMAHPGTVVGNKMLAPDVVVIDATTDQRAAFEAAAGYKQFTARIVMLVPETTQMAFIKKCKDAGAAVTSPAVAGSPMSVELAADYTETMLQFSPVNKDHGRILWIGENQEGNFNPDTHVLTGPNGSVYVGGLLQRTLAIMLSRPGFHFRKADLTNHIAMRDSDEIQGDKIVDVALCKTRAALDQVGLNGTDGTKGPQKDSMLGTIWGGFVVYDPKKALPATRRATTAYAA